MTEKNVRQKNLYNLYFDHVGCSGYADRNARSNDRHIAFFQVSLFFRDFKRMIEKFKNVFFLLEHNRYRAPYQA